ncbi:hypothetical protein ACN47E_010204 [Coniothyrium glycines]
MSNFAPPTRRGDFSYSSLLYADPGNNNPHPRASTAELAALLRPEVPNLYSKGRKPDIAIPAKDPAWHFYAAQCIHYGLPVTKDKNAAKVRLLNAMNQFKLEIPAWVLKTEGELKKEWEAENRKMKKVKSGVPDMGPKGGLADKGKGRAGGGRVDVARSGNIGVNVSVNLFPYVLPTDLGAAGALFDYAEKQPVPAKRKRIDNSDSPATPLKSARTETKSAIASRVKQEPTSKRSSAAPKSELYKPQLWSTPSHPCVKREHISPRGRAHSPYTIPSAHFDHRASSSRPVLLSGTYEVDCPTASDMFGDHNLDFTLARDNAHDTWWSTFRWGAWDFIAQIPHITPGQRSTFSYRLRNMHTGQLHFTRDLKGEITFEASQTMRGVLWKVPETGTVEFSGSRMKGGSVEDDLKGEWEGFVKEAYRRY